MLGAQTWNGAEKQLISIVRGRKSPVAWSRKGSCRDQWMPGSRQSLLQFVGGAKAEMSPLLFSQVDLDRKIESVAHDLEPLVQEAVFQCVVTHQDRCLDKILTDMHLLSGVKEKPSSELKLRCLQRLIAAINRVLSFKQESSDVNITVAQKYLLNACSEIVDKLFAKVEAGSNSTGGQFEWVDSILINAVEKGDWLLIDDANFCSPSVLDRLNSLLEPGGVLTITEQGVVQGDLRTIRPHPDFRKEEEGFDERNVYYPYPVSNFPNRSRIRDRFFCIIRILIESSTVQLNTPIKYLDVFLQSIIKQEIEKLQPNVALKRSYAVMFTVYISPC
ncbi:midasin [Caerostris extrusa]|uniref:Midasin n=1 Tax=Caerostris extrusa TaxID=172846 RepID=A0AAV4V7B9_CAEEX|nr:midasin [Caerostris extrusa]